MSLRNKSPLSIVLYIIIFLILSALIYIMFSNTGFGKLDFFVHRSIEYSNGAAKITNEGTARIINKTTFEPLEKTTMFKVEDKMIYVVVKLDYLESGITIKSEWSYNGQKVVNSDDFTTTQAYTNRYFSASLPPPQTQYPIGKYTVELVGTKNGNTIFSIKNYFEVK